MTIKWNDYGQLLIEQDSKTMVAVNFYDLFHDFPITRLQKLEMLQKIVEQALNDPDMTEPTDAEQLKFDFGAN